MSTEKRLIEAAGQLLDTGGEEAVTLRVVSQAVGVSHNAPYRHFKNRNALLAAVVATDFERIALIIAEIRQSDRPARTKLLEALGVLIDYGQQRRARYRLLMNNPTLGDDSPELQRVRVQGLSEFFGIVEACQSAGVLPDTAGRPLGGLLLATLHGLLALEARGPLPADKGLTSVTASVELLVDLLGSVDNRIPRSAAL